MVFLMVVTKSATVHTAHPTAISGRSHALAACVAAMDILLLSVLGEVCLTAYWYDSRRSVGAQWSTSSAHWPNAGDSYLSQA